MQTTKSAAQLRADIAADRAKSDDTHIDPDRVTMYVNGKPAITYTASPVCSVVIRREGTDVTYYHR